jgi:hypothetical protein
MEITQACFHAGGKHCNRRIASNSLTGRDMKLCGRCFRALFGIPFGPVALRKFRPRIPSWTSAELFKLGLLARAKVCARIASSNILMTADSWGSFTRWNGASKLSDRASALSESERAIPSAVTRGGEGVETCNPSSHFPQWQVHRI